MQENLNSSPYFNYEHASVQAFSAKVIQAGMSETEKAVALYYAVRDGIRYNPYVFEREKSGFSASHAIEMGQSYCIPKAVLLAALCRLNDIPARIGLMDIKNHLSSPALIEYLRSEIFVMHGYTEIYLEGKWVKATPAFDAKLCAHMEVKPLEFNGKDDSIFHEYNGEGERYMEYVTDHGLFSELPYEKIIQHISEAYPHLAKMHTAQKDRSLQQDLEDS